jgi:sugar phosphate permease
MKYIKFNIINCKYYPILVISLCASFLFYKYVLQIYPSTITNTLMAEFHLTAAGLGNLAATYYYSYMIAQILVGPILDKYSARYLTSMAIFACGMGMICFAHTHSLLVAQLARIVMGIGVSFATIMYLQVAASWFHPRHYSLVSGFLPTAAMAGACFSQAPLTLAINYCGWRAALDAVGVVGVVMSLLFVLLVRDKSRTNVAHATGLSLREIMLVFKNKQNWLLTLYSGLIFTPVAVFGSLWGNPFLQEAYNINKTTAGNMISCVFIGLAVGGPILGIISEHVANRRVMLLNCTAIALLAFSIVLYCHRIVPLWLLGLLLFVFGFVVGSVMIVYTIGKEGNSYALTATVFTMINASDAIFTSITEPGIGKLLDLSWDGSLVNGVRYFSLHNYVLCLGVLPVYLAVAGLLLFWVTEQRSTSQ